MIRWFLLKYVYHEVYCWRLHTDPKGTGPNRLGISVKHYDTSAQYLTHSAENSLKKLNIDKIDLLLIHRPDPLMDADETAKAFGSLKESGKVLHFGVSNFTPSQFSLLQSRLDFPLVTNQVEFHPAQLVPVLGTNEPDRIRSAVRSVQIPLEREEWFRILEAGIGKRVP